MPGNDIGYYTIPVILSFDGVEKSVNSKLGSAFKGIGAKAGKDLGTGMRSAEGDIKKATAAYEKLKDRASDSLGKVRTAEAQLQSLRDRGIKDAGRIAAAEEKLATARRNSTRSSKEAEAAHSALGRSHDVLDTKVTKGNRALTGFAGALDNVSGRLGGVGGQVAGFGSRVATGLAGIETGGSRAAGALIGVGVAAAGAVVGVAALGAVAVVVGKQFYDLGASFDDASDTIRIKTGATGADLDALNDAAKRVSTTTAASVGDLSEVVVSVSRAMNVPVSSQYFDGIVKNVANLQRMTGEEIDMPALGKVFSAWKIGADQAVPALDKLFNASRATGKPINELLPTLTKFGPALREISPDIGVAVGLLSTMETAGIDADIAFKGLGAASKEFARENKSMNQGLSETFAYIASHGDAEGLNMANKIFGKAGPAIFEQIKNGTLTLEDLTRAAAENGDTIAATAADTADWSEKWTILKNKLAVKLEPVATGVFNEVNEQLENLSTWVVEHQPEIIGFFGAMADAVLAFASSTLTSVGHTVVAFGELVGGIGNTYGAIMKAYAFGQRLLGRNDIADQADRDAEAAFGWGEDIKATGNKIIGMAEKATAVRPKIKKWTEDQQKAAETTVALGDAVLSMPDGKDIKISENTPEVAKRLSELDIKIETLPDGTFKVVAKTDEAQKRLDDWRKKNEKKPVEVEAELDIGPAAETVDDLHETADKVLTTPHTIMLDKGPGLIGSAGESQMRSGATNPGAISGGVAPATTAINDVQKALGGLGRAISINLNTEGASTDMDEFLKKYPILDPTQTTTIAPNVTPNVEPGALTPDALAPGSGPDYTTGTGSFASAGLLPNALRIGSQIHGAHPTMVIGGKRQDPHPDHPSGKAIDVMVGDTIAGRALGNQLFGRYIKDPGVKYILWQQTEFHPGQAPIPMKTRAGGDRTQNHYDHLHIMTLMRGGGLPGYGGGDRIPALLEGGEHVFDKTDVMAMGGHGNVLAFRKMLKAGLVQGFAEGGQVLDWDALAKAEASGNWANTSNQDTPKCWGGLQFDDATWAQYGGTGHASDYSREEQIAMGIKALNARGGPKTLWPNTWQNLGWKPDGGPVVLSISGPTTTTTTTTTTSGGGYTAGTGPGGEAGYYTAPNPGDVQKQKNALQDAQDNADTEQDLLDRLKANQATEAEVIAQQAKLDSAKAKVVTEKAKLAEIEKGKFTEGDVPTTAAPGYRRVPATETAVAEAHQDVVDAKGDLDAAIAIRKELAAAREKMNTTELGETPATDEQKKAADKRIADKDAEIKRLEKEVQRAKERETQVGQGTYEEGKDTDTDKKKTNYDTQIEKLGELPTTLVNGLLESIGIGDVFPSFLNTPTWKSIAAGITAFKGPIQGLVDGKLGVQQPGWSPGQPIPGSETTSGGGQATVPMPFGLPGIQVPAPLPDEPHGGSGAPPGPNVDASVNINYNGPVGSDPEEVRKQNQRMIEQRSIPRLPVGS